MNNVYSFKDFKSDKNDQEIDFIIGNYLDDYLNKISGLANLAEITIRNSIAKGHGHLHCKPSILKFTISELLHNAIRYTPPGRSIYIDGKILKDVQMNAKKGSFLFTVTDQGYGLTEEQIEKAFQAYTKLDNQIRENKGSGLGLTLVREGLKDTDFKLSLVNLAKPKGDYGLMAMLEIPSKYIVGVQ